MALLTRKGLVLPSRIEPAVSQPVVILPADTLRVYLPLSYTGSRARCLLSTNEVVYPGKQIAESADDGQPVMRAHVFGVFAGLRDASHPLYGQLECAAIDCMPSPVSESPAAKNFDKLRPADVLEAAEAAGIIDELDGHYLYRKLEEYRENYCDLVIADGAENQGYASSAWAVMNESVEQIWMGVQLAALALRATAGQINVRLKRNRRRPLARRINNEKAIFQVRRRYPAVKLEKNPWGRRICRIGVQACLALYRAAVYGEMHGSCVVTVSGDAVKSPRNIRAPFGTTAEKLLEICGLKADPVRLLSGDVMTGRAAESDRMLILPGVTCLLALTEEAVPAHGVCCGCGRCVGVCHAGLLPFEIVRRVENMQYEQLASLRPDTCDGCGCCSHVCPAGRELSDQVSSARDTNSRIYSSWEEEDEI
ncbi:MAG: hypothetical protein FWE80_02080 [Oscillospiraceae bacterium]|nr:hypothetical protein [Oscillospiraceae bacterium]